MRYAFVWELSLLVALGASGCTFDRSGLPPPARCGNGVPEGDEDCDGTDLGGATCASEGFGTGILGCQASGCRYDYTQCSNPPQCGNDELEAGEECDDGNETSCDGCSETCQEERCGNDRVDCGEECDDGNLTPGDGCSATCTSESPPECGNHVLEAGEECDDGNLTSCDGCSAICEMEACGNARLDCGEECEDGNLTPGDGCSATCTSEVPVCGDHVVEGPEICEADQITETCQSLGYLSGTLGCAGDCLDWDTTQCGLKADGQPCVDGLECDSLLCFTELDVGYPGGACFRECSSLDPCNTGFTCEYVPTAGRSYCYQLCSPTSPCRVGYGCFLDPWNDTKTVCRPHCESNAECTGTGDCNLHLGRCDYDSAGTGDYGESCTDDNGCLGFCFTDPTNGYCHSMCELTSDFCPTGGICVDVGYSAWGDEGWCMATCTGPGGMCPQGDQTCTSTPDGFACLPPDINH
jgi:cysteine-rich repeat protein